MCVAVPGVVVSIGEAEPGLIPAQVRFDGFERTINLIMTPDVQVGDHIVTHSGYSVRKTEPYIEEHGASEAVPGV